MISSSDSCCSVSTGDDILSTIDQDRIRIRRQIDISVTGCSTCADDRSISRCIGLVVGNINKFNGSVGFSFISADDRCLGRQI